MIKRIIANKVIDLARHYPVITLTGPRQSGKTTLCRFLFADHAYFSFEDPDIRLLAETDPRGLLEQVPPQGAIFDEIQKVPHIVSYLQGVVDNNPAKGRFILTGSEQLELSQSVSQSLAGRTAVLRLLPFSFAELYGADSSVPSMESLIYQGFYPRIHDQNLNPTEALGFYVNTYIERDVRSIRQITNLTLFQSFLKLCAANIGNEINKNRMSNDIGVDSKTVEAWLTVLEAGYIIFRLPPHFRNYRKRTVKSPKLYFYDIGLASFLLGISNEKQVSSHPLKGALFENFIITELIKNRFNKVQESNLYFYRDQKGYEVDVLIDNGLTVDAIEIKSAKTFSLEFLKNLEYYANLNSQLETKRLIYGGDKTYTVKGVEVMNYSGVSLL